MKRKFWNWIKNQNEGGSEMRTLFLNGQISDESWFGDEVTPKLFKDELAAGDGPISVWINSPGGDVFAAAQIYNMLMDYPNDVPVMIDGLAASAASVIAMAGTEVQMSPVAMMMIHNSATVAIGDSEEMKKAVKMLDEVKESIMNAYEIKTGLPRDKISRMMDAESWFNANKAVELGFADLLYMLGVKFMLGEIRAFLMSAAGGERIDGNCINEASDCFRVLEIRGEIYPVIRNSNRFNIYS